jgi:predicted Fe-S protein YdhL (DUF1289 family)
MSEKIGCICNLVQKDYKMFCPGCKKTYSEVKEIFGFTKQGKAKYELRCKEGHLLTV